MRHRLRRSPRRWSRRRATRCFGGRGPGREFAGVWSSRAPRPSDLFRSCRTDPWPRSGRCASRTLDSGAWWSDRTTAVSPCRRWRRVATRRTERGATVLEVRRYRPWFSRRGWRGSRRCSWAARTGAASRIAYCRGRSVRPTVGGGRLLSWRTAFGGRGTRSLRCGLLFGPRSGGRRGQRLAVGQGVDEGAEPLAGRVAVAGAVGRLLDARDRQVGRRGGEVPGELLERQGDIEVREPVALPEDQAGRIAAERDLGLAGARDQVEGVLAGCVFEHAQDVLDGLGGRCRRDRCRLHRQRQPGEGRIARARRPGGQAVVVQPGQVPEQPLGRGRGGGVQQRAGFAVAGVGQKVGLAAGRAGADRPGELERVGGGGHSAPPWASLQRQAGVPGACAAGSCLGDWSARSASCWWDILEMGRAAGARVRTLTQPQPISAISTIATGFLGSPMAISSPGVRLVTRDV